MMDVDVRINGKHIIVSFSTSVIDISKAKIIEKIISNLPDLDTSIALDLKSIKSIDLNGFNYLQSIIENIDDIKVINLHDKYKKLVS